MKKSILLLFTAGLLTANLCIPASAVSLVNARSNLPATPAVPIQTSLEPDAEGTISFQNIKSRMRTNNLAIRSLQATLDSQKAYDRKLVCNELRDGINQLSDQAWETSGKAFQASIESLQKQLDSLKEEDYNKQMDKLILQTELSIEQVIMGGEELYLNILSTECSLSDLNRNLKSMERSIKEMELRYDLGQVSKLTFEQLKSNYTNTKSQAAALELSIEKMKASLQVLLGESPTGKLTLEPLPSVSQKQKDLLRASYNTALQIAKEKSLKLSLADKILADAKKTWSDAKDDYIDLMYQYKMAEQTYKSAEFTYNSTVKDFELSFQNLYKAIPDSQQALEAAEAAVAYQQQNYATAELKHQQGQLSDAALQDIEDALLTAKSSVTVAELKMFTAWNHYEWAIELGMIG